MSTIISEKHDVLNLKSIGQELNEEEKDPIEALGETIPGTLGEDYPIFATPPETSFICDDKIQVCKLEIQHCSYSTYYCASHCSGLLC